MFPTEPGLQQNLDPFRDVFLTNCTESNLRGHAFSSRQEIADPHTLFYEEAISFFQRNQEKVDNVPTRREHCSFILLDG